jgi:hypothetical protein
LSPLSCSRDSATLWDLKLGREKGNTLQSSTSAQIANKQTPFTNLLKTIPTHSQKFHQLENIHLESVKRTMVIGQAYSGRHLRVQQQSGNPGSFKRKTTQPLL